jgi:hypothetical protein
LTTIRSLVSILPWTPSRRNDQALPLYRRFLSEDGEHVPALPVWFLNTVAMPVPGIHATENEMVSPSACLRIAFIPA